MTQKKDSVYIIAEAGVNHNGDIDRAKQMIDVAKGAGADAIKFQTFTAQELVTKQASQAEYQTKNIGKETTQYEMLKALEISAQDHKVLIAHCEKKGIHFMSSAFSIESARFLSEDCAIKTIKLGSGELTNAPLLLAVAQSKINVILSTGMSTVSEVKDALSVLAFGYFENDDAQPSQTAFGDAYKKHKNRLKDKVSILQCTTDYPCAPEFANLNAMETLRREFGCPIGFSDHTLGDHIVIAAVAKGAKIVEKHFTLDRNLPGPDHKASLEADELKEMIKKIRDVEAAFGHGERKPFPPEEKIKLNARKSIVAKNPISKGEAFTENNITTKRPENGLSPMLYWDMLGKQAQQNFDEDEAIK